MYFWSPRITRLSDGERFPTCHDGFNVPAYYPTLLALKYRRKSLASATIELYMQHLVHFEQCCIYNDLNILRDMEDGKYPSEADAELLADAASISTKALAKYNSKNVIHFFGNKWKRSETVNNQTKSFRISVFIDLINVVGKCCESKMSRAEKKEFQESRREFTERLADMRPRVRDLNRVKGVPTHDQLGRLTGYLLEFGPNDTPDELWKRPDLNERNWAILRMMLETGLRNSELRGLKAKDVNLNTGTITVFRRPDDPEDPRLREPNTKTHERMIPISDDLCQFVENYVLSYGSEAAQHSGSPFLFLSHANSNFGQPIGSKTIQRIVREVGNHLQIADLRPHDLRHSWIQNLADWSIKEGIQPAEFDRLANNLGGWSYMSTMATRYRGDQLTKYAFEKGLDTQKDRFDV